MIDPHLYEKVHRGTQLMSGDMSVDIQWFKAIISHGSVSQMDTVNHSLKISHVLV